MPYLKTVWETEDVITGTKMNKLENQVELLTNTVEAPTPISLGGTGANTRLGAQSALMYADEVATASTNPATMEPGIYALANSAYDTTYWPAASLWGVLMICETSNYKEAIIICSGSTIYRGHFNNTVTPLRFIWYELTPTTVMVPTASNGVTIRKGGYVKNGKIVTVDIAITTDQQFTQGIKLFDVPTSLLGTDENVYCLNIGSNLQVYGGRVFGSGVYCNTTLPAGDYNISGTYIALS